MWWLLLPALLTALAGALVYYFLRRRRAAAAAAAAVPSTAPPAAPGGSVSRHTELVARVVNHLDWNARSCESGRWILNRVAAQAMTKGAIACDRADELINVKAIVDAIPGANEITRQQVSRDLIALLQWAAGQVCKDGATTGAVLAAKIQDMMRETCDPAKGTLLSLYVPATSKMPMPM